MAYPLEGVVGATATLAAFAGRVPAAVVVPLRHGIALIPLTDDLHDTVTAGTGPAPLGFWELPPGFDRELAALSTTGPVAYVEAEFFGGTGTQRAALWRAGGLALGPLSVTEDEPFPETGSPISRVLAELGVPRAGAHDEFEAAGLSRHRATDDWPP